MFNLSCHFMTCTSYSSNAPFKVPSRRNIFGALKNMPPQTGCFLHGIFAYIGFKKWLISVEYKVGKHSSRFFRNHPVSEARIIFPKLKCLVCALCCNHFPTQAVTPEAVKDKLLSGGSFLPCFCRKQRQMHVKTIEEIHIRPQKR